VKRTDELLIGFALVAAVVGAALNPFSVAGGIAIAAAWLAAIVCFVRGFRKDKEVNP
jgi:hypothetical protein